MLIFAEEDSLTIRAGVTSSASVIAMTSDLLLSQPSTNHSEGAEGPGSNKEVVVGSGGLYVRLIVKCNTDRKFRAVFSLFSESYEDQNGQCKWISVLFTCILPNLIISVS